MDRAKKCNLAMEGTCGTLDFEVEKIIVTVEATNVYPQLKAGDYLKSIINDTGLG